ncbi:unnamed protein product [Peniophora sp. CBMAI 1063]|nr:unnamed protein product [Peniophora sp. CBMAI 1063]
MLLVVKPTPGAESLHGIDNAKAKIQDKEYRREITSLLCATAIRIFRKPAPDVESADAIDYVKAKIRD